MKMAVVHTRKGLTLIETMLIVAIVGILASVAIPAIEDYMVKMKVREAVSSANPARIALGIACSEGNLPGMDNESLGLPAPDDLAGDYVRSVVAAGLGASGGTVIVTLAPIGDVIDEGRRIVFTGACGAGGMTWTVGGDVPPKYRPEP